jgi:branched-chain amino acid transport system ATP-binding protein
MAITAADGSDTDNVTTYGIKVHFEGVRAVDGVDLCLSRGEIKGLIGPNGAGKTTFMHAISGFVRPTAGRVMLRDTDVTDWRPNRLARAGLVRTFQDVRSFRGFSVFENVYAAALASGLSLRRARARANEVLETLDMASLADLPAASIAQGDERRLGLARAIATGPRFLMLDEPAAGLNDHETTKLMATVKTIRDDYGPGLLVVDHDMRMIMGICDRIQVLDSGQTLAEGTPAEVMRNERVLDAYLGSKQRGKGDAQPE